MPQFLQRMEKRAREREEKHAMIKERRRQMEEERIRLKQQVNNNNSYPSPLIVRGGLCPTLALWNLNGSSPSFPSLKSSW